MRIVPRRRGAHRPPASCVVPTVQNLVGGLGAILGLWVSRGRFTVARVLGAGAGRPGPQRLVLLGDSPGPQRPCC